MGGKHIAGQVAFVVGYGFPAVSEFLQGQSWGRGGLQLFYKPNVKLEL